MKNATTAGPLRKSTVNPQPPVLTEGHPRGKGVSSAAPTKVGSMGGGRVLVDEAKPAGRNSTDSTFTAPRKEPSHNPAECGYTKP